MKENMLILMLIVFVFGCSKDEEQYTYQMNGIEGTVQVYRTLTGIAADNAMVKLKVDGINMTSDLTNNSGKAYLSCSYLASGSSTDKFPSHVSIYAYAQDDPSIDATESVALSYQHTETDGSVKIYKGVFSTSLTIKK